MKNNIHLRHHPTREEKMELKKRPHAWCSFKGEQQTQQNPKPQLWLQV